ncbi:MAG: hypothetical protein J6M31_00535 [Bacteroidales bacterium]|nr:hypothetical protein [Bacteroidales bacterium]
MRAKEYIACSEASLKHPDQIRQIVDEMLPLRASRQQTVDYYNRKLIADIRLQACLLQKELYEKNNAMQTAEPEEFQMREGEIPVEIAAAVRDELFDVIKDDKTFGYLYFLLGNLRNSQRPTNPIDCVPDERGIVEALKTSRDDYPKSDLAAYLDDDINFAQYQDLTDAGIADEAKLLSWFNNAYRIYDQMRLVKSNPIAAVRVFLDDSSYESQAAKDLTGRFICEIISRTAAEDKRLTRIEEELNRHLPEEASLDGADETAADKAKGSNKIRTAVIYEILNKLGKGKSFNDLSKICNLVAYLTGGSPRKIYNEAQKGIQFTDYHKKELSEVNKILSDLSLGIELKKDKEY